MELSNLVFEVVHFELLKHNHVVISVLAEETLEAD